MLNQLYKHTAMQEAFTMIFLVVANGQPSEMGLIQAIQHFIDHRVDVVRRRTAFLLPKPKDREHILEGYLNALDQLDDVIAIIRASENRGEGRENLVAYFAGKKIDMNTQGTCARSTRPEALHLHSGRSHPRPAIAPADPAFDR